MVCVAAGERQRRGLLCPLEILHDIGIHPSMLFICLYRFTSCRHSHVHRPLVWWRPALPSAATPLTCLYHSTPLRFFFNGMSCCIPQRLPTSSLISLRQSPRCSPFHCITWLTSRQWCTFHYIPLPSWLASSSGCHSFTPHSCSIFAYMCRTSTFPAHTSMASASGRPTLNTNPIPRLNTAEGSITFLLASLNQRPLNYFSF